MTNGSFITSPQLIEDGSVTVDESTPRDSATNINVLDTGIALSPTPQGAVAQALENTSDTTVATDIWGSYDGSIVGSPTYGSDAPVGSSALDFGSGNNDVEVSHDPAISTDQPAFTITAWVYPNTSLSSYPRFVNKGPTSNNFEFFYHDSGNDWRAAIDGNNVNSGYTPDIGAWQHLAAVRRTDDSFSIYVNGTRQATITGVPQVDDGSVWSFAPRTRISTSIPTPGLTMSDSTMQRSLTLASRISTTETNNTSNHGRVL